MKKILIASDHAGFEMKKELISYLKDHGYEVEDFGAHTYDREDDYPDFIGPLAKAIGDNPELKGIILGGSGQGEAICANRFKGVRAVVFNGPTANHLTIESTGKQYNEVKLSRQHNNSNVISLGVRFLFIDEIVEAVEMWLGTAFSGEERHSRRIAKIDAISNY